MTRRRPRRPAPRRPTPDLPLFVCGLALAAGALIGVLRWLREHPGVLVALVLAALTALAIALRRRRDAARAERARLRGLRYALPEIDALHHTRFEETVRDLMRRDGCADAVRCGGAGDNGADVKATDPLGRLWVIQCKHRRAGLAGSPVGTPDLHVLNGTGRPVHGGDVIVLVTNGRVTANAAAFARSQRLHLVDRAVLARWAADTRPLWELLDAIPPPRRPHRGS
ncbi:restriction endonuclease (plasmid) [Streptomyces sp. BI20]|uniref:restriction endonuclease n=1 Tax=Streptomyces sp. BI20 TaxID=3403460 RepID=UPI003C783593